MLLSRDDARMERRWLPPESLAVLSNFDGTATPVNTLNMLLAEHASGDWRATEDLFNRGVISYEDFVRKQYGLLDLSEEEVLAEFPALELRSGFQALVETCAIRHVYLTLITGGFHFLVRNLLLTRGWTGTVGQSGLRTLCTRKGMAVDLPRLRDSTSFGFKDDLVRWHQRFGRKVIYVGSDRTDYDAARLADCPFAIAGSDLARLCRENAVKAIETEDFHDIASFVEEWVKVPPPRETPVKRHGGRQRYSLEDEYGL